MREQSNYQHWGDWGDSEHTDNWHRGSKIEVGNKNVDIERIQNGEKLMEN